MAVTSAQLRVLRPFTIIQVAWEDAWFVQHDDSLEEAGSVKEKCMRFSVGFVVRADKEYVIIAQTDDRKVPGTEKRDKPISDYLILPAVLVHDITVLAKPTRR